jgi:mannose-6-phosphate isomerase-like protein (cupin superfamily)
VRRSDPVAAFTVDELRRDRGERSEPYHEFLLRPSLSAGVYELPAGGTDTQRPHGEDEVYVVLAGSARLSAGDSVVPVEPGSIVFVRAGVPHSFQDIAEDLAVLVLFAPAES